jgi:hypothetical protein
MVAIVRRRSCVRFILETILKQPPPEWIFID